MRANEYRPLHVQIAARRYHQALLVQVAAPDAPDPGAQRHAHQQHRQQTNVSQPQQDPSHAQTPAEPAAQPEGTNGAAHEAESGSSETSSSKSGAGGESEEEGQCEGVPPDVAAERVSAWRSLG